MLSHVVFPELSLRPQSPDLVLILPPMVIAALRHYYPDHHHYHGNNRDLEIGEGEKNR